MNENCSITPPKAFRLPEGKQAGDTFDMVCTFRVESGGKLTMTKLGDTDCNADDSKKETAPSYKPMAEEMAAAAPKPNSY